MFLLGFIVRYRAFSISEAWKCTGPCFIEPCSLESAGDPNHIRIIFSNFQKPLCLASISQISGVYQLGSLVANKRKFNLTNLSSKQASHSKCGGASSSTGAPTWRLKMTVSSKLLGPAYESGLFDYSLDVFLVFIVDFANPRLDFQNNDWQYVQVAWWYN